MNTERSLGYSVRVIVLTNGGIFISIDDMSNWVEDVVKACSASALVVVDGSYLE